MNAAHSLGQTKCEPDSLKQPMKERSFSTRLENYPQPPRRNFFVSLRTARFRGSDLPGHATSTCACLQRHTAISGIVSRKDCFEKTCIIVWRSCQFISHL